MENPVSTAVPRKRYPGPKPFQQGQEYIFFGRDQDITDLFRTISVNELTVLHGKSGLGKTSLLNAGVAPHFEREGWTVIFLRFHAYDPANHPDALQTVLAQLRPFAQDQERGMDTVFLPEVQPDATAQSLWQQFKSIQWHRRETAKGIVVFFDQFEELFTYPPAVVEEFGRQFGEVLDNRMPESFRASFYQNMEALKTAPDGEAAVLFIKKSLPLKLTLSIRSDRTSLVDRLKPFHEHVLRNLYELQPLTREQAQKAIEQPAELEGDLDTPRFSYAPDTVTAILDFLTENNLKPVESTQIQVICQHVENNLLHSEGQVITREDLGDIKSVYKQYYDRVIAALPVAEQTPARLLIENELIFEPEQRRLSLYEGQVLKKIKRDTLRALVDEHHLLRVEEHLGGGRVYELSHDSLVQPVLGAKKTREKEEQRTAEKAERRKLRRQRALYFGYGLLVTGLAIMFYLQSVRAQKAEKMADNNAKEAQHQQLIAEQNAIRAQIERDSALALRANLGSQTYKNRYEQGKMLMEENRFADALPNFLEALKIAAHERNEAELKRLIDLCRTGSGKEISYRNLMREADDLRDQKKYLEAFPIYQRALALNFDNERVQQSLGFCERDLRNQLSGHLRRAMTFLDDGKNCDYANLAITSYADPIISALNLPAGDDLRQTRDKIWKQCPH